ncbi:TetR/AcrR family transcriptional regulator [Isoptericola sp. NPDC019482]|uniref:TetR/AcrR family transcriptional regulator n=1 Tax=Isoptericola sp. NPDC019482 TaxID=3154688 RepID=UPI00347F8DFF
MTPAPSGHSPRKAPKQARSRRTVGHILAAAARVFGELGYAATTTDRIAQRAEVSVGSLYQYFPNKDAVLHALALRHLEEADAAVRAALSSAGRPPASDRAWLEPLVDAVVTIHAHDPALQRVILDEASRSPELVAAYTASHAATVRTVAELLLEVPGGHIHDPGQAALLAVTTVESVTHRFAGHGQPFDSATLSAELLEMLTAYLVAKRTS